MMLNLETAQRLLACAGLSEREDLAHLMVDLRLDLEQGKRLVLEMGAIADENLAPAPDPCADYYTPARGRHVIH